MTKSNLRFTYRPSWIDRLNGWVDHLPGPYWSWYLGGAAILFVVETLIQWGVGHVPFGRVFPFHAAAMGAPFYALWLIHYLDHKAARAFDRFLPAFDSSKADPQQLRYRLTTMPARPTVLFSLVGVLVAITNLVFAPDLVAQLANIATFGISLYFNICVYVSVWVIFGALVYHTIHQLRGIHLIYTRYTSISLLKQYPLHAFSNFTLHAAVGLGLLFVVRYAEPVEVRASAFGLGVSGFFALGMTTIFFVPLLGIHGLLVEAKEQALSHCSDRIESILAQVRQNFAKGKLEEATSLRDALALLEDERTLLVKVPTWPWQPETLRAFLGAMLLPLALWLAQSLLERYLTP